MTRQPDWAMRKAAKATGVANQNDGWNLCIANLLRAEYWRTVRVAKRLQKKYAWEAIQGRAFYTSYNQALNDLLAALRKERV